MIQKKSKNPQQRYIHNCIDCGRPIILVFKIGLLRYCKGCYIRTVKAIRRRD